MKWGRAIERGRVRGLGPLSLTGLACALASCSGSPNAVSAPPIDLAAIEFAGCASVHLGPVCIVPRDREIRIWVPSDIPLRLTTSVAGQTPKLRVVRESGARRYDVAVPDAARFIRLSRASGQGVFTLNLAEASVVPALDEAKELRAKGRFADARRSLERALPSLTQEQSDRAHALLARIAFSEGDIQTAVAGLRVSSQRADATGRVSEAADDAFALSYMLCVNLRQYVEARAVLTQASRWTAQDPSARPFVRHYAGVIALETGDLRSALHEFQAAATHLQRLGLHDDELLSRQQYAATLSTLGRHAEALHAQERVVADFPTGDACAQVDRQETVTWFAIVAEPRPGSEPGEIGRRSLQRTEQLLASCPSPWHRRNHAINAALLAVALGETEQAESRLAAIPASGEDLLLDTWEQEARGRLFLATQRYAEALHAFERARQLARRAQLRDNVQLALLGLARSLAKLGRSKEAIDQYLAGESVLDEQLEFVPLSEGPAGFQHAREAGTRELIELMIESGDVERALWIARKARTRITSAWSRAARLAHFDPAQRALWEDAIGRYRTQRDMYEKAESESWRVPSEELSRDRTRTEQLRAAARAALDEADSIVQRGFRYALPPPLELDPTEVVLAYFPAERGVRAFVVTPSAVRTAFLPQLAAGCSRAEQSKVLLEPFRAELASAAHLRVIAHAALASVDIHAMELDGVALGQRLAIAYALDILAAPSTSPAALSDVLIVANPTADLPSAEVEARRVSMPLSARNLRVETWLRDDASRARVSSRLRDVDIFHFAGHARYAGLEGIDSSIIVADGEITVGDVLSLPRAPQKVMLSACEGARSEGLGFAGGLGVAQAFVAAGATEVIASARPVRDEVANEFFSALYAALPANSRWSGADAVRSAVTKLRESNPGADWASFRLLTP